MNKSHVVVVAVACFGLTGCKWIGAAAGAGGGYVAAKWAGRSDKEAALAAAAGGVLGFIAGDLIGRANARERQRAEAAAKKARARLSSEQIARYKRENKFLAVKANDGGDKRMIADPGTGAIVDENTYRPTAEGLKEGGGKFGDHQVVFVDD